MTTVLLLCLTHGWFATDEGSWLHERRTVEMKSLDAQQVVVANPFGDVRVRGRESKALSLIANIQKRKANPAEAKIVREVKDGVLHIRVDFPSEDQAAWRKPPRRVDLTLVLPPTTPLSVNLERGYLEAKGLQGAFKARGTIGDMYVKTAGPVDLANRQGKITVVMKAKTPAGSSRVENVHGAISFHLHQDAGAEVAFRTRGKIITDFSLEIESERDKRLKRGRAVINGGGPLVTLISQGADVEIGRLLMGTPLEKQP